ncbi:MAG: pyrroline-5-carboxylate reductase [Proteobacteria bacterium]|nr:MAG: pyrroline-5-carboxylate reductase [Pseudomonadota bacterium]
MLPKTTIIGGGNMGLAFAEALLSSKLLTPDRLSIIEALPERQKFLAGRGLSKVAAQMDAEVLSSEIILLAVKPQDAPQTLESLNKFLSKEQLVVSIMAGRTVDWISKVLSMHSLIARGMPNLAAPWGKGITIFFARNELNSKQIEQVEKVFSAVGKSVRVKEEGLVDAATALTGTGPAYFFFMAEVLAEMACELGFAEGEADLLAREALSGAAAVALNRSDSLSELRQKVASKGGTTEAAFDYLLSTPFKEEFKEAIRRAYHRSKELAAF